MGLRAPGRLIVLLVILGMIAAGTTYGIIQGWGIVLGIHVSKVHTKPETVATSILSDEPVAEVSWDSPLATGTGVIITGVMSDGPADQAGLRQGDVIIAIDGQRLDFDYDLVEIISTYDPGDVVTLQVERPGDRTRQVTIKLGRHPGQEEKAHLGVVYRPAAQAEVSEAGLNPAPGTIHLASRDITREELTRLAPFEVLWPQDLPDGYRLLHIVEMSESLTESSNSGIFYLEYIDIDDQDKPLSEQSRLFIWQRLKPMPIPPSFDDKQAVGTLRLADGTQVPIYQSEGGRSKRAFMERGQVSVELSFWGVPPEDVAKIASSLAAN